MGRSDRPALPGILPPPKLPPRRRSGTITPVPTGPGDDVRAKSSLPATDRGMPLAQRSASCGEDAAAFARAAAVPPSPRGPTGEEDQPKVVVDRRRTRPIDDAPTSLLPSRSRPEPARRPPPAQASRSTFVASLAGLLIVAAFGLGMYIGRRGPLLEGANWASARPPHASAGLPLTNRSAEELQGTRASHVSALIEPASSVTAVPASDPASSAAESARAVRPPASRDGTPGAPTAAGPERSSLPPSSKAPRLRVVPMAESQDPSSGAGALELPGSQPGPSEPVLGAPSEE